MYISTGYYYSSVKFSTRYEYKAILKIFFSSRQYLHFIYIRTYCKSPDLLYQLYLVLCRECWLSAKKEIQHKQQEDEDEAKAIGEQPASQSQALADALPAQSLLPVNTFC